MVKKISGNGPVNSSPTSSIESTQGVKTGRLGSVSEVGKTQNKSGVDAIKGGSHSITPAQRDNILRMVEEEAEKLFENAKLSPQQKKTARSAVKMAIDASVMAEEE